MVSPDGSGRIPQNQEKRLHFMGQWLARNGEAIYATRAVGLDQQPTWGYVTRSKKGDHLYAIVRHWPENGVLHVPVVAKATSARLLGGNDKRSIRSLPDELAIDLTGIRPPDPNASTICVDVEGPIEPASNSRPSTTSRPSGT